MRHLFLLISSSLCFAASFSQSTQLHFNGSTDHVDIGNSAGNGIRSIEFWVTPEVAYKYLTEEPASIIIRNNDNTQNGEFGFYFAPYNWADEAGHLVFHNTIGAQRFEVISDAESWTANNCHHVAAVIDPQNGMSLYIDGVQQQDTDPTTEATINRPEAVHFGRWGSLPIRYFEGTLDEIRFWDRALTASEILSKMNATLIPSEETGLVGYWKMDDGSGFLLSDATTNGYDGAITGADFVGQRCFGKTESLSEQHPISVSVYPNPATDVVRFDFSEQVNASFVLLSAEGKEVMRITDFSDSSLAINTTHLPAGMYYPQFIREGIIVARPRQILLVK
jgi:hypothetical protein